MLSSIGLQVCHQKRPVAGRQKLQIVGDEKNGDAFLCLAAHHARNGGHIGAVQSACGVVENQNGRVFRKRTGNHQALLFAAREALRMPAGERQKVEFAQNVRRPLSIGLPDFQAS